MYETDNVRMPSQAVWHNSWVSCLWISAQQGWRDYELLRGVDLLHRNGKNNCKTWCKSRYVSLVLLGYWIAWCSRLATVQNMCFVSWWFSAHGTNTNTQPLGYICLCLFLTISVGNTHTLGLTCVQWESLELMIVSQLATGIDQHRSDNIACQKTRPTRWLMMRTNRIRRTQQPQPRETAVEDENPSQQTQKTWIESIESASTFFFVFNNVCAYPQCIQSETLRARWSWLLYSSPAFCSQLFSAGRAWKLLSNK